MHRAANVREWTGNTKSLPYGRRSSDTPQAIKGEPMTEDEALSRFGLAPTASDIPAVRDILTSQIIAAENEDDDSELIKLCCIQLFSAGDPSDAILIWAAKRSSFDNGINIEVQLLCGAGVERTKEYLTGIGSQDAVDAVKYITSCEVSGDFEHFTTEQVLESYRDYYGL